MPSDDRSVEIEEAELFRSLPPQQLVRLKPLLRQKPLTRGRQLYVEESPPRRCGSCGGVA